MKRILITGAGGFIGYHLVVDQLQRGNEVTAVDLNTERLQPLANKPNLHIIIADFSDARKTDTLLPNQDVCFHLASAHLETGVSDDYFWKVNVINTECFLQRCHRAGVHRIVHCSSVGVYGDIKNPPADEDTQCNPEIPYEKSKLAGERAVLKYATESGYDVIVIRPAWVYGLHCPRTFKLFKRIQKGRFFFIGDGCNLRHPIYIDDMIDALERVANNETFSGQIYIIAGPRAVTIRELVDGISHFLGKSSPSINIPKWVAVSGVYMLELAGAILQRDVPFTQRSFKFFLGNNEFDILKARKHLDFHPQVDLLDGLSRVYDWMKENQLV
jgi:nucleoside-diphosphate-sugar epimerase